MGGADHVMNTHLSVHSHRSLRMISLLLDCAKLKMLMAWFSTLGGAHSSLGETITIHVGGEEGLKEGKRRKGGGKAGREEGRQERREREYCTVQKGH